MRARCHDDGQRQACPRRSTFRRARVQHAAPEHNDYNEHRACQRNKIAEKRIMEYTVCKTHFIWMLSREGHYDWQ